MSRTFNAFEKATIKNSAKAVAHYLAQNEKIQDKITELQKQQENNLKLVEQYSEPVRNLTGFEPLDLCEKVARGTSQNDWVFKYPTTIVPPQPEDAGGAASEAPAETSEEETPAAGEEQPADREPEAPAEQPADTEPETPAQPAEEETHENETAQPAVAESQRDPMDDIF